MNTYLAKFTLNGKAAYKIGHTKFWYAEKRFNDPQYNMFDSVSILGQIHSSHENGTIARNYAKLIEETLKGVFPKNFRLEEHFVTEDNKFTGLSGITEMFILEGNQTEQNIIDTFMRVKRNVERVLNDKAKVYMDNISERRDTPVS